jgi:hypothetical protein
LFQLFFRQEPALAMMLSLYVTLGIFMLVAARNPSENRSLIAFTAWSSFAHAVVTALQAFRNLIPRGELVGVGALVVIGLALVVAGTRLFLPFPRTISSMPSRSWRRCVPSLQD